MNTEPKPYTGDGKMSRRWSKKQRDFAAQIANNIVEDIDEGATRKELRMVAAILQDHAHDADQRTRKIHLEFVHLLTEAIKAMNQVFENQKPEE